ncbi:MAG: hypothetical protein FWE70_00285 [Oscillospiraceae bacterium]|nr:hypothetical protein [Oscillospiraceae bacterium]
MPLTGRERTARILRRQPVDRIGVYEHFWSDTQRKWEADGFLAKGESMDDHFGFDMSGCWCLNFVADLDKKNEVVEETEETVLIRDGNGALLRRHKLHDSTPEHVDFMVKERAQWEGLIKPHIKADRRRIGFAQYREAKRRAAEMGRFFFWSGVNVFELLHPVCGHEGMLVGMSLDPDWIKDMVATYAEAIVSMQETLFDEEGEPDGVWYYEDLGFKDHPFVSPAMYREILMPAHKKTIGFAKGRGLPVVMHSCGMVDRLVPGMIESGIDCLQVIEVKAGMDLLSLYRRYGEVISFMGGIDVRAIYTNDRDIIDRELFAKIPTVMGGNGYVLHSDHSIPATVDYETFRYYLRKGMEIGTYGG